MHIAERRSHSEKAAPRGATSVTRIGKAMKTGLDGWLPGNGRKGWAESAQ